jgi:N-acetylglucosamine repressor
MDKMITGSFQLMKKINKTLVLDIIRQHAPISRAKIAKMTKLTPPTVTNLVRDLLNMGMIKEAGRTDSTGGRKAINLQINAQACYIIGVNIGVSRCSVVIADLQAKITTREQENLTTLPGSSIMDTAIRTIERAIVSSNVPQDKLIGMGVGMHGLVNSDSGIAVFAPNFGLRNIAVKQILEDKFGIPVYMDNNVRVMELGESWLAHGKDVDNFVFLNVGMGIGAGVVLNQEVYRGMSESEGEIGQTTIVEDGPQCNCGNYGCLEALAAGPAITKRVIAAMREGARSSLTRRVQKMSDITAYMIYEEAVQGDELSKQIIENTGKYLGIGVANLINMFNPEKVILGGSIFRAGDMLLEPLVQTAMLRAMEVPASHVTIQRTALGRDVGAIGAATLVYRNIFKVTKVG